MYFYEVGYWDYEGSDKVVLMHETKFNEEEFEYMFLTAGAKVAQDVKEHFENEYDYDSAGMYYFDERNNRIDVSLTGVYEDIADAMCEIYGFQKVEATVSTLLCGYQNLNETLDEEDNDSEPLIPLSEVFRNVLEDVVVHKSHKMEDDEE